MDNSFQSTTHLARRLSEEERSKLKNDVALLTPFKREKLEKESKKNWDLFYKRNATNFFKDRHWTKREFDELCVKDGQANTRSNMLEVGCGVGNTFFPLLQDKCNYYIHACDFSPRAIEFVKNNPLYHEEACHAFVCDITCDDMTEFVKISSIDIATLIFVLSSITPSKMHAAVANIKQVLKDDGILLFRDYGLYDHAMLRFANGHKIDENFYVRQDGTRAYFFSEEMVRKLFLEEGFEIVSCEYVLRETVNKKENLAVPRVFVQGKFRKLIS